MTLGQTNFNITSEASLLPDYAPRSPIAGRLTIDEVADALLGRTIVVQRTPEREARRMRYAREMFSNSYQREGRDWDAMWESSLGFAADFAIETVPGYASRRGLRDRGFDKWDEDTYLGDGIHEATGTVIEMKRVREQYWTFLPWKIRSMLKKIDKYDFLVGADIREAETTYAVTPLYVAFAPLLWDAANTRPGPYTRASVYDSEGLSVMTRRHYFDHRSAERAGHARIA